MKPTNSESRKILSSMKGFPIGSLIKTSEGKIMTITNIEAFQHVDTLICKITAWSPEDGYVRISSKDAEEHWVPLEDK